MVKQLRLAEQGQISLVTKHGGVVSRDSKVCFLVNGRNQTLETLRDSNLASVRMRLCVAADALLSLGVQVRLTDSAIEEGATHLYVSKPDFYLDSSRLKRWTSMIQRFLVRGGYLIVDFSDNHLASEGPLKDFYGWLLPKSHKVICNSGFNADVVRSTSKALVEVIEDPLECPILAPSVPLGLSEQRKRTLMWFGHASNLPYLIDFLVNDFRPEIPVRLICLTNIHPIPDEVSQQLTDQASSMLEICFIEWSQDAMVRAAKISDACILPAGANDPRKMGASANRLLTALALGLPVAADTLDAYRSAQRYFLPLRGDTFADLLLHPESFHELVLEGQVRLLPNYEYRQVMHRWVESLTCKAKEFVRLNLGCGDKILPGYINVDVVDQRAGTPPDVIADIRNLCDFPADYADEILAVHVIEHFWRWEVEDILREWCRVLRPGGRLILECPNLRSACEEFLKVGRDQDLSGPDGQRSMWVFYGDPAWRDPLMNHRWGYTPESLGQILREVGFENVSQKPAQFKLREPRDMRVVGYKKGGSRPFRSPL